MIQPEGSRLQLISDLTICRVVNGMWQVSGAHGPIDRKAAIEDMFNYQVAGFTTPATWRTTTARRRTLSANSGAS